MLPFTLLAAIVGVIGGVCAWRKIAPRFVAAAAFLVGANIAGWAGALLARFGTVVTHAADTVGGKLVGVGLSAAVVAGLAFCFWLDIRKKGKCSKAAPIIGLLLPSMLPTLFGALTQIPVLSGIPAGVHEFTAALMTVSS